MQEPTGEQYEAIGEAAASIFLGSGRSWEHDYKRAGVVAFRLAVELMAAAQPVAHSAGKVER